MEKRSGEHCNCLFQGLLSGGSPFRKGHYSGKIYFSGLFTSTSKTFAVVLPIFFTLCVSAGTTIAMPVFNSLFSFLPSFPVNSVVPPEMIYRTRSGWECMADDCPGL